MANDDKNKHQAAAPAAHEIPKFDPSLGEGLTNFAARLPQYDGGDARVLKPGTLGAPIHGHFLGTVDLPSTIKDRDTGEARPWVAVVIELLQPCPVKEGSGDKVTKRMAVKGERIIFTVSKAFENFSRVADHPTQVYEAMIQPEVSRTKANQSLWTFPQVKFGRPIARRESHMVGIVDLLPATEEVVHAQLPAHTAQATA
jgi:hypothetical protein